LWIKATKQGIYIIKKEIENFFFKEERIKNREERIIVVSASPTD